MDISNAFENFMKKQMDNGRTEDLVLALKSIAKELHETNKSMKTLADAYKKNNK